MKVIPTKFNGVLFRSRLEARWAVFFDALMLKWEFEPEGFILSDGTRYLPDFRVISTDGRSNYYEIKPLGVSRGVSKALLFGMELKGFDENANFALLTGSPDFFRRQLRPMCPICGKMNFNEPIRDPKDFFSCNCDIQPFHKNQVYCFWHNVALNAPEYILPSGWLLFEGFKKFSDEYRGTMEGWLFFDMVIQYAQDKALSERFE